MLTDVDYFSFSEKVKLKTGINLSYYRKEQMKKQLSSLYNKHGYESYEEYFYFLIRDAAFFNEFVGRITFNITEFYRNPDGWEHLQKTIIPRLMKEKVSLKCWSAGCSTGEEPYTLAMVLKEMKAHHHIILASDLSESSLIKARQGRYQESTLKNLPHSYKERYFRYLGTFYEMSDEIKANARFVKSNLLHEPFEFNFDLIMCRNVMIYLTDEAKNYLLAKLAASLRTGGILFIGSSETIEQPEAYGLIKVDKYFYKKV